MKMGLIKIESKAQYDELKKKDNLLVVHFTADWSPQSKQMNEVIEEMTKLDEMKDVIFAFVPAEDVTDVSLEYEITAVPTFVLLLKSNVLKRIEGADAAGLTAAIKQQVARISLTPQRPSDTKEDIQERLKKLVNLKPSMLFMKGSPNNPKCGFSRTTVGILEKYNAKYGHFDILEDNAVRQGLKQYSNWPTYPQLYIDGSLIGGLDIIKELDESGELEPMLPKDISIEQRLKELINKSPVMVFMKGNRDEPRCGFSRTLIGILKETGLDFETFDILKDEEVRQELKKFSNWPTYPQVYVKGQLEGGLDIIKELKEEGSLISALKGEL